MGNLRSVEADIQNPEIREILREVDPRGGSAPYTVEEKRRMYVTSAERGKTSEVSFTRDSTIPGPAGDIPIRAYYPAEPAQQQNLPVVLYLHGGGFFSGNLDTHSPVCSTLALRLNALVVAVDYRLAPEHPYPAALDDCFASLLHLASQAGQLGGDPSRLFVAGDSAGGNLAAALTLLARDRGGPAIKAQVLIYPMLDATLSFPSQVENALIPPFTLLDCVYAWQLYLPQTADRGGPYVSPVFAEDLSALPPALIVTGEYDILADEGSTYADRLRDAGVDVEVEHFPDMVHGFFQWSAVAAGARVAMNRVVHYLHTRLGAVQTAAR